MRFHRRLPIGFAAMCVALAFGFQALATTVSPSIIEVSLEPGGTYTNVIALGNDEDFEQTYYFSIQKFIAKGEFGQQEYLPPGESSGLPSWIYLDRPSVTLKPGSSRQVQFSVRVPADAQPGGYYAAIFFSNVPPVPSQTGAIVPGARIGTLVLLTVRGPAIKKLALKDFFLASPKTLTHLPAVFQTTLENQGSVHLLPEGSITITNVFGATVGRIAMNQARGRVLPSSVRTYSSVWKASEPRGNAGFWAEVGEEWRNFAIGPYKATLTLSGDGMDGIRPRTVRFFIWPWRLLSLTILIIVLFAVAFSFYRRRLIRAVAGGR